jgi:hypothetical protein
MPSRKINGCWTGFSKYVLLVPVTAAAPSFVWAFPAESGPSNKRIVNPVPTDAQKME